MINWTTLKLDFFCPVVTVASAIDAGGKQPTLPPFPVSAFPSHTQNAFPAGETSDKGIRPQ